MRETLQARVDRFDQAAEGVQKRGHAPGAVLLRCQFGDLPDGDGVVDDFVQVVAVELDESQRALALLPLLLGDESVEAGDHVAPEAAHRPRAVDQE